MASRIKARRKMARLTPEEDKAWFKSYGYHKEQGKTDAQSDARAWRDIRKEFPRLREFTCCG